MSEERSDPLVPEPLPWHESPWAHALEMLAGDRFPHALLLHGPRGVGKVRFARRLAAALVCESQPIAERPCGECRACVLSRAGTHPDIHWIVPEAEGKAIRIDAVRTLIGRSSLTTQAPGLRVFLICPADALNRAAANALLKTLEEPVPSSVLILISSAPHRLPATIISRCQQLKFRPVEPPVAAAWLRTQTDSDSREVALSLAGGAPLLARDYLEQGRVQQIMDLVGDLQALKNRKGDPVAIARGWKEWGVGPLLDGLRRVTSDLSRQSAAASTRLLAGMNPRDLQQLAENIHLQKLFRFMDELSRLERQSAHNLNPQMLAERLVNSWLNTTRMENH